MPVRRNPDVADVPQGGGMVLLSKPSGMTSFAALGRLKRVLGTRRIGHTGTLDRFASGLLIAMVGRLTRISWLITELPKRYRATIRLGEQTTTLDPEGPVELRRNLPTPEALHDALPGFVGRIRQVPPAYSAVHVDGERASRRARRGLPVKPRARDAYVDSLRIIAMDLPQVEIEVVCGKGTYVRSLARDLAVAAGSCGHLTALRRLSVGPFSVEAAAPVDAADEGDVIPPSGFLHRIESLELRQVTPEGARRVRDGQPPESTFMVGAPSGERFCALLSGRELLAVIEPGDDRPSVPGTGCTRSRPRYRYRCVLAARPDGGAAEARDQRGAAPMTEVPG